MNAPNIEKTAVVLLTLIKASENIWLINERNTCNRYSLNFLLLYILMSENTIADPIIDTRVESQTSEEKTPSVSRVVMFELLRLGT